MGILNISDGGRGQLHSRLHPAADYDNAGARAELADLLRLRCQGWLLQARSTDGRRDTGGGTEYIKLLLVSALDRGLNAAVGTSTDLAGKGKSRRPRGRFDAL